ncbi:GtrA family protein [Pseudodesulfovibrio tunisiensis]|uniref:GtrA family protein n=1 Tax=Pseudodesulfovibrio tunisiensis TaxID=463192 RepID=UPI001FB5061A|nr:GtrA family protein [Pseudodesulfovibrio tunisiensis]
MLLRKRSIFNAPIRYTIVVIIGFCVDFSIYSGLVWGGLSIYVANVIGFTAGAMINVWLIRRFVFPDVRFKLMQDIGLTLISNGFMLLVGLLLLYLFAELMGIDAYLAKILANGTTFVLNYLTRATLFRSK